MCGDKLLLGEKAKCVSLKLMLTLLGYLVVLYYCWFLKLQSGYGFMVIAFVDGIVS